MWKLKTLSLLLEVQGNFHDWAVFGEMWKTENDTGEFLGAVLQ